MADLFVSYASEDRETVAGLVKQLENRGYTLWWDRSLKVGGSFDKQIEDELDKSSCVLVFWSPDSIDSDWVRAEAGEGLEQGCLVQVLLDDLRPPLVFRQQQAFRYDGDRSLDIAPLFEAIDAALNHSAADAVEAVRQSLWLVADFENRTDDAIFTGTLTRAVEIGLDYFSEIYLYPRDSLLSVADRYQAYLAESRPLAEREGLGFLLGGSIAGSGDRFLLTLTVMDLDSKTNRQFDAQASDHSAVMKTLAGVLREAIDATLALDTAAVTAQVEALDLACVYEDLLGADLQARHDHESAVARFQNAIARDPGFVPAHIGQAISFDVLGRQVEAQKSIDRALDFLDRQSERDQHRTQVMYHLYRSENYQKALDHSLALSKISPLDVSAINNEALARCNLLDFEGAVTTLSKAVALAPDEPFYQVNLALYCLYAGEFDRAISLAEGVLTGGNDIYDAHLALWCSLFAQGQRERCREILDDLTGSTDWYRVNALLGLADLMMAEGELDDAWSVLEKLLTMEADHQEDQVSETAKLMQAEIALTGERDDESLTLVSDVLSSTQDARTLAGAAILAAKLENTPLLEGAFAKLKRKLDPQSKACARMVEGLIARVAQDFSAAEQAMAEAIEMADLWMLHFVLADLYATLDLSLEAKLEQDICRRRPGEGMTAWINRMPTCRYLAIVTG